MVGGYFLGPHQDGRADFGPPLRATDALVRSIVYYDPDRTITSAERAAFRADLRLLGHRDRGAHPGRRTP